MPLARVSAQVILKTVDNIPANFVTNTYHFLIDYLEGSGTAPEATLEGQTDQVADALKDLYDDLRPVMAALQQTGHRIKFVNIDEPKPQYPYQEVVWDLDLAAFTDQLPNEVAIVSSFEAAQVAGVNQASRRGRVFIGPVYISTTAAGRIRSTDQDAIEAAFSTFSSKQDTAGFTGWQWMVYSPKLDEMARVVSGHVDNAFDTQRRRGLSSTLRVNWT